MRGAGVAHFIECLERINSALPEETRAYWREHVVLEHRMRDAKERLLLSCRSFFVDECEETLIRPLATTLGLVPDARNIRAFSRAELDEVITHSDSQAGCEWLEAAYTIDSQGTFLVRATQDIFPVADGPNCKYAALFDKRSLFDGLRYAFLVSSDPRNQTTRFQTLMGIS